MKLLLASVLMLFAFAAQAVACSCMGPQKPCEAYGDASAIFVGTVSFKGSTTVKEYGSEFERRLVRLHVDRAIKGVEASDLDIETGLGDADCGFNFRLGGQYLVYAYGDKKRLQTSICSRTRLLTAAAADLEYFKGLSTAAPGGTIFGEVIFRSPSRPYEQGFPPVKDAKILFKGPDKQFERKTDAEGKYSISGLPPGTYKVKIEPPEGMSIYNAEVELQLIDRGCRQTYFTLEPDTRITGKVLDAQGQSAADVLMELIPVTRQEHAFPDYVRTDKEGRYLMRLVKPGRYYLGVRIAGSAGATYVPYPQIYYPGVKDKSQATVLTVAEGQRIELDELVLGARFIDRTLSGTVVDEEGKPVAGAAVWLKERQYEDSDMPYRKDTDSEGRFSFSVYEGIKYSIVAFLDTAERREKASEPLEIVISSNQQPIKLVLKKAN